MAMAIRRGRRLEAVADGLVETSPSAVFVWLLRTTRMSNPDPAIHTQFRFGELLGRDGTFVSHVEGGRRPMPPDLSGQWFDLIGLDVDGVTDYLVANRDRQVVNIGGSNESQTLAAFTLVDDVLNGAILSPREWAMACSVAGTIQLPRTVHRFCHLATEALASTCTPGYQVMLGALRNLPDILVINAVRDAVDQAPSRGNHAADLLGGVDAVYAGPVLKAYFRSMPDPWMDRGVVTAVRQLVGRGDLESVADNPASLQEDLIEAMAGAASWMTRVELANLARELGPMPESLRRRLANDPDTDVRVAAGGQPDAQALALVGELRRDAVLKTLDNMFGAPVSDPLAEKMVGLMILGRTEPTRIRSAQALALSPYRGRCVQVVVRALGSSRTFPELRRAACLALANLGPSAEGAEVLTNLALGDSDPSVRARATWSLISHQNYVPSGVPGKLLRDLDEIVRCAAIDLAGAMSNMEALQAGALDNSSRIVILSLHYLARV